MAAGRGDLHRPPQARLALDVPEIGAVRGRGPVPQRGGIEPGKRFFAREEPEGFIEGFDAVDRHSVDQGGFLSRSAGQEDALLAQSAGEPGHRQTTPDRPGGARKAQFPGDQEAAEPVRGELAGGDQDREGDGKVIDRALLPQVAGSEVDRGPRPKGVESAVAQRGEDAVVGLLHGGIRQSDENQLGFTRLVRIDLDLHELGLNTLERGGGEDGEHAAYNSHPQSPVVTGAEKHRRGPFLNRPGENCTSFAP